LGPIEQSAKLALECCQIKPVLGPGAGIELTQQPLPIVLQLGK